MRKNTASQVVGVQMVSATDGSAFTGSVTVVITGDGGTQGASGGTAPAHEGNGLHTYTPTQAETNYDHIAFTFTGSGAIPVTVQVYTQFDAYEVTAARMGALTDWIDGGRLDLLLDAIKAVTDALPDSGALTTIGTDTARLTAVRAAVLTDWIDGGRLDLLLDAIKAVTDALPDSGALTTIGTDTARLTAARAGALTDWIDGGRLDLLLDALIATVGTAGAGLTDLGGMSTGMKAEVNVEAKDVIATDTIAELAADPGATPTLEKAIMLLYMLLRNKVDVTSSAKELHNDAGSVVLTKTLSDSAGTYSESKMA